MKFGVGISTCREGLTYPTEFLDLQQNATLAQEAERLGFYSLWANDHFATQQSVANTLANPPNFYEPLITLAYISGQTVSVRFLIATVVAPLRDPVLLSKQAATLDQASKGRLTLGLGIGSYREEFEAIRNPPPKANRGRMMEEQTQALRMLFNERRAAFEGQYFRFTEIEVYPKPVQDPFPIFLSGNTPHGIRRVARLANGWIAGRSPTPERLRTSVELLRDEAQNASRDPSDIEVSVQFRVAIGRTDEDAYRALSESQHFKRLQSTVPSRDAQEMARDFSHGDLMGTPSQIAERVSSYRDAGAEHLGLVFLANSPGELFERVTLFGEEVLPLFR